METILKKCLSKIDDKRTAIQPLENGEERFKCPTCDYACASKEGLAVHTLWHVQNNDVSLKDVTLDNEELKSLAELQQKMAAPGSNGLTCSTCDFSCDDQDHLAMHMLGHARHGDIDNSNSPKPNIGKKVQTIVCPVCKFETWSTDIIAVHLLTHAQSPDLTSNRRGLIELLQKGLQPNRMDLSSKIMDKQNLDRSNWHGFATLTEKYDCKTCGEVFHNPDDLGMHMISHVKDEHPEPPKPKNDGEKETFLEILKKNHFWTEYSLNRPKRGRPRGSSSRLNSVAEMNKERQSFNQRNIGRYTNTKDAYMNHAVSLNTAINLNGRQLQRSFSVTDVTFHSPRESVKEPVRSLSEPKWSSSSNAFERSRSVDNTRDNSPKHDHKTHSEPLNSNKRTFSMAETGYSSPLDLSVVNKKKANGVEQMLQAIRNETQSGTSGSQSMENNANGVSDSDSILQFAQKNKEHLMMCKYCNIIFVKKTLYCIHMGLHNLNNPLQCNVCGKVCKDTDDFFSHVIHYN